MVCVGFCSIAAALTGLNASNTSAASTISVTSSGAQSINVRPDVNNNGVGASIGVDEITVNTTCRAGYNFSISTSVNDNNLYLNGSSTNNQTGKYFTPSDGTTALSNATNTWGYYFNSSAPTTAPTTSNIFQPVPTLSSTAATIKTPATTASTTDISDSFNIYYGVSASSNLTPGTYKMIPDSNNANANGVITYYVTMDTSCDINTISYNANNGSGAINPQEVQNGDSVALADNAFTRSNHYFMGWSTNQNATTPEYRTNQTITPTSDMTLYAVWGDSTTQPLYNTVASLTKGTQSNDTSVSSDGTTAGIQATITKANSGVYTYDPATYGDASDAATTNSIHYYRGILDTNLDGTTSTYGSNGDSMDYPNYVILDANGTKDTSDTCWRIVRTTGSGGVKMIYNGKWTGSTCANASGAAQVTTKAFNGTSSTYQQIVRVGYTYNSTYATNTSQSGTIAQIFGTNSTPSVNDTRSTIKEYIEDTWYPSTLGASGSNYTSILEPSAGYCNDRTMNTSTSWTTPLAESTTIASTYGTSGLQAYYFGAYPRNMNAAQPPSLTCGNRYSQIDRNTVDLYRYVSGSTGVSNQLKYPVALLTADEASFAGSGRSTATQGSAYHYNSYLRSGSGFWLLSPDYRTSYGGAYGFYLHSDGDLYNSYVFNAIGVRPTISLASGTTPASGSGTAIDPWVVTAPPATINSLTYLQDFATLSSSDKASVLNSMTEGTSYSLKDNRDQTSYNIVKLADGKVWLQDNLALDLTNSTVLNAMNESNTNASNATLGYLKNGGGTTSDKYAITGVVNWTDSPTYASSNSYSDPLVNLTNKDVIPSDSTSTAGGYKLGGYYNYCAASAGSYCYGNGTSVGTSSGNATESICPAGWRMPGGDSLVDFAANPPTGEYQNLYDNSSYNTYARFRSALRLPLAGRLRNGSVYHGSYAYYWSSTRLDNNNMYVLFLNTSSVMPFYEEYRTEGFPVRCVVN